MRHKITKNLWLCSGIGMAGATIVAIFVGFGAFVSFVFSYISFGGILLSSITHLKAMLKHNLASDENDKPVGFATRFGIGLRLSFAPWRILSYAVFIAGMIWLLESSYFHLLSVLSGIGLSVVAVLFINLSDILKNV